MQNEIVDLSYLYEIADNDPGYISDVLEIFLSTIPEGVDKLNVMVTTFKKWDDIYKQSHFLKSSVTIVRVKDMFENLIKIERLAKDKTGKEEITKLMAQINIDFKAAHPLLIAEHARQVALKPQA